MDALQTDALERFYRDLLRFIRRSCAAQCEHLSDGELREKLRAIVARAEAHGMTEATAVAAFAAVTFTLGEDFDRDPDVAKVLADSDLPQGQRLEALLRFVPPSSWPKIVCGS